MSSRSHLLSQFGAHTTPIPDAHDPVMPHGRRGSSGRFVDEHHSFRPLRIHLGCCSRSRRWRALAALRAASTKRIARGTLLLLGFEPGGPDPELGYIVPSAPLRSLRSRPVSRMVEKPPVSLASSWHSDLARDAGLVSLAAAILPEAQLRIA
jgi:hypothetical protein